MLTVLRLVTAISLSLVVAPVIHGSTPATNLDPPTSSKVKVGRVSDISLLAVEAIDPAALLSEDLISTQAWPRPTRFALPVDVTISPAHGGTWEDLPDGSRLWRLRAHAPNATDLNFGFRRYRLPPGATLHIIGEADGYYQGPYTSDDNKDHGELWTAVVPGERAVIELFVPSGAAFEPELELGHIGRGYRDLFQRKGDADKRGVCNINVVCPQGDPWRDQIRSVGRYTISGMYLCTGSLVRDQPGSFTPYFLSAAHCSVSASNDHTVVVYWNHQTDSCAIFNDPNLSENQTGSTFRASYTLSDLLLIELDSQPAASANVFYAGWDARDQTPSATTTIHHPAGSEKSISFDNDPPTITSYLASSQPGDGTHFSIADWDEGTTEGGSSGACLFDNATGRCIGTLHGGYAACGNDAPDWYGRVSRHWSGGGTSSTRLSNWLDPNATGALFVDGANGGGGGGGGDGVNVSDCGNVLYDDGTAEGTLWFGGGGAGIPDNMHAVKFVLADFGYTPGNTQITRFCAGNLNAFAGGPWPNEVFIYPAGLDGMPDDGTVLARGTIATGDGGGWYEVTLAAPVTLNGDFWLVNRGDPEWAGQDFNMDYDSSSDAGRSFGSNTGIANLAPQTLNLMLRATLQTVVPDEAIFSDGFESGDTLAWSSAVP